MYGNGKVSADSEMMQKLTGFSEREIARGTGLHRKVIRTFTAWRTLKEGYI